MSRIRVTVDKLVLEGIEADGRQGVIDGLQAELARVLDNPAEGGQWARPYRAKVMRLGVITLEPGPSGGHKFGRQLGGAIGRSLRP